VRGDLGLVGHRRDGTERLGRLSVRLNFAILSVDTGEVLVVALAVLKDAINSVVGDVVVASDTIEDVFAIVSSVGFGLIASLEAELVTTDEAKRQRVNNVHGRERMTTYLCRSIT
jgi:hypothetical protein